MIRVQNIPLSLGENKGNLTQKVAKLLQLSPDTLEQVTLVRQSIDARKKSDVHYVCTVDVTVANEDNVAKNCAAATVVTPKTYTFPQVTRTSTVRPVVVGMGPAGLFAALQLARAGLPPIVLERGQPVEQRVADVDDFWRTGVLNTSSNVQFGEGGAGTFSDGKLTTGIKDPRIRAVNDTMIAMGAGADIAYSHKPHIGTDVLRSVVKNIRKELLSLGCDIRFGHQLTGLTVANQALTAITVMGPTGEYDLPCDSLILAVGHSARDTFSMLFEAGVQMEAKPFAIGLRIEHLQETISAAQYGNVWPQLPPSDYKLACHLPNGRSAFSFCVCPGGHVVAAASEAGGLVINGMSHHARDGANINGGFLVGVTPEDFGSNHPLAGVTFQRQWEEKAYHLGGRQFHAPAQRVGDFLRQRPSKTLGTMTPTYQPGVTPCDLHATLPSYVSETLRLAIPQMDRRLHGFGNENALLTGVETRSSSPVRIVRNNDTCQSLIRGLYPCGEGAGYAGGIMSAAVDGIRVAEQVAAPTE